MASKPPAPVSTRYPSDTLERLDRRARTEGNSRSTLIQRYVAEGIEMDEHPGVVFRSGPAGRRPGLVAGPDIWEVVAVHRSFDDAQRTADWLEQPPHRIETALRYYQAHRSEIDDWIRRNEEAAEAAERVARARLAASSPASSERAGTTSTPSTISPAAEHPTTRCSTTHDRPAGPS